MKGYRCKRCMWEAVDKDSILEHLHEEHPMDLETSDDPMDLYTTVDVADTDEIIEIIRENAPEKLTLPIPPKRQKRYPYPRSPYFTDNVHYACTECNIEDMGIEDFWKHVLAVHPEDGKEVLTFHFEQELKKQNASRGYGTSPVPEEQYKRWAEDKWNMLMENLESDHNTEDILSRFIDSTSQTEIKKFVQGKKAACMLCGRSYEQLIMPMNYVEQCKQNRILLELGEVNPQLEKLSVQEKLQSTFKGMWNLDPISLNLRSMLHLGICHQGILQTLVSDRILKGDLALFLAAHQTEKKEETLTALKSRAETLGKADLEKIKWLKPRKKV